jgi:RNA polymerase sigma-70 factor (ECF subfamily)
VTGDVGDEWARALFAAHGRAVRGYVARRISPDDVDDVVVDVFVVAWRRRDVVTTGEECRPYQLAIARRTLANRRRSTVRRLRIEERLRRDAVPAGDKPDLDAVVDALEQLRPDDQEILRLAAWEGLSASEIAVVLECTAATASVRLSRARTRLRDRLQETPSIRTSRDSRRR